MFGKRLAQLRNNKGISQYELAERLMFSRGQIANYEQGTREPDFNTLIQLADFFDVSLDYLLGRIDTQVGINEISPDENNTNFIAQNGLLTEEEIEYLRESLNTYRKLKEKWD